MQQKRLSFVTTEVHWQVKNNSSCAKHSTLLSAASTFVPFLVNIIVATSLSTDAAQCNAVRPV